MNKPRRNSSKLSALQACREMSASRKAAGLTYSTRTDSQIERDWRRQIELMPDDTRSLTARIAGDPIPGDPRCPWRPVSRTYL